MDTVLDSVRNLYNHLDQLLKDGASIQYGQDFICEGYSEEVDALKKIAFHSDELLLQYQQLLAQHTGINSIKIKFIKNQGYYIEVTNKDIEKLEASSKIQVTSKEDQEKFDFQRRQTLKGAQRYTTPYIDMIQEKILSAKDELRTKEYEFLGKAQEKIASLHKTLHSFAEAVASLDVYVSHALFVKDNQWVKPDFVTDGTIEIIGGRHPVIEAFLPMDQQFIPNDLVMG